MKYAVVMPVALALLLGGVGQARAGLIPPGGAVGGGGGSGAAGGVDPLFTFTFSDAQGDVGHGTLNAVLSPGSGTNAFQAISGTLDVTSSQLGNIAVGTYTLLPAGPGATFSPSGFFIVDNLLFPSGNASTATDGYAVPDPSYLTNAGLLFGPGGSNPGSQTEVNIWGNGNNDYAFYTYQSSAGFYVIQQGGGVTFTLTPAVPEPSTLTLLGLGSLSLLGYRWRRRKQGVA